MRTALFFLMLCTMSTFSHGQSHPAFVISAHRGYSNLAPENTLSAFRKAIEVGADYFECDVRRTQDDSLVILHDATIDRTTNRKGKLASFTYADLRQVDAGYPTKFGKQFAGEKLPTLREALALAKGKIKVEIEIKEAGLADDVVALVQELGMASDVSVISFDFGEIQRVKELAPAIPVKYLVGKTWGQKELDQLLSIRGEYLGPSGVSSPELIQLAHDKGVKIIAYTFNTPEGMAEALAAHLDGIATDFPEEAMKIRAGR
ncbi:glycerophosphoryl diester phosphodiesterase [Catalinimonas alkaloidigena]|uniref:Glycerophosphoryl diester phosphodiesterase n=1 Tax=Catalinimonas alkaloidigena TaxID=1075417 RepID=A0A1G9KK27_9BACT|nr:glycerophosphodiester phosphodiesterase family protein [Catalinimonas alkaloidigena]SDL49956.1 glycerophosphoryl diester phosphodiesterase [Catalinimonas alkaloidigena]